MALKQRARMPTSQRAKQFMPFAAVKGLEEALRNTEQRAMSSSQQELCEEQIAQINQNLCKVQKGMPATITYFLNGRILTLSGIAEMISEARQTINISSTVIPFSAIRALIVGHIEPPKNTRKNTP